MLLVYIYVFKVNKCLSKILLVTTKPSQGLCHGRDFAWLIVFELYYFSVLCLPS